MTNTNKKDELIQRYTKLSAVHNYLYGFIYQGNVYAYATTTVEAILDKASSKNGGGYSLRYRPTAKQKAEIVEKAETKLVITEPEFMEIVEGLGYKRPNKGEGFEKMIVEKSKQEWKKDVAPFTERGDVVIDGIDYQVKFEKATFASEIQIARFEQEEEEK